MNGQLFGHRHECSWNGNFVFLHCGKRNLDDAYDYWGGIRIANSEFEAHLYEHRIHDIVTHETIKRVESVLKFINITGAGILHYEKSAAIQSIMKSPAIVHVNIDRSAYHGINVVSPTHMVCGIYNLQRNMQRNAKRSFILIHINYYTHYILIHICVNKTHNHIYLCISGGVIIQHN